MFAKTLATAAETVAVAVYSCSPEALGMTAEKCTGLGHCPPFAPAHYPATSTVVAGKSGGDWKGAFGADGYVLFGFDNGTDVVVLPEYVVSIGRGERSKSSFVGRDAGNASFLENPKGGARALGVIANGGERRWVSHRQPLFPFPSHFLILI